jgi:hypothetical protein
MRFWRAQAFAFSPDPEKPRNAPELKCRFSMKSIAAAYAVGIRDVCLSCRDWTPGLPPV